MYICVCLCVWVYVNDLEKMLSLLGPLDYDLGISSAPGLFQHVYQETIADSFPSAPAVNQSCVTFTLRTGGQLTHEQESEIVELKLSFILVGRRNSCLFLLKVSLRTILFREHLEYIIQSTN